MTHCFKIRGTCHHLRIFLGYFWIFFWCSDVSTCIGTHTLDTVSLFLTTWQLCQLLDTMSTDCTEFDTNFCQKTYRVDNSHNFSNQAVSKGFVIWHQFDLQQNVLWCHFLTHENHMSQTVYIEKKCCAGRHGGSVVVCILWSMGRFQCKIFVSCLVECMNSYNIRICIFYEFNGLNIWIHTNMNLFNVWIHIFCSAK